MNAVERVKVYDLIPIYKTIDGVQNEANAIQIARVELQNGEQLQYDIVVGKGLYNIGDSAIYIQPDYCLPQLNIFNEYHFPGGDASKCKLGRCGRIRAIKFNFNFKDDSNPIYSNGIILPLIGEVKEMLDNSTEETDLVELFQITKYVAEDSLEQTQNSGMSEPFPSHLLYKTDEPTLQTAFSSIQKCYEDGEVLSLSIKKDGSSISLYYFDEEQQGICSRQQKKKLDQTYVKGYKENNVVLHPYFNRETGEKGWFNDVTQQFITQEYAESNLEPITVVQKDAWVDTVMTKGYYPRFIQYCKDHSLKLALRGELIGLGNKGSGNKLNQDAKLTYSDVYWFGVDNLESGHSRRIHYGEEYNLEKISNDLNLQYAIPILEGVFSYEQLVKECLKIFDDIKEKTGQIIEGVVIRTKYSNRISVKMINPLYDSKN